MQKIQSAIAIALVAITAGCASHQYTRDDVTDKIAFRDQLTVDSRLCKAGAQANTNNVAPTAAFYDNLAAYDACMLAHGWRHRNPGEARFHDTSGVGVAASITVLGAGYRNLNASERRVLQTNKGVVVTRIIDDSPAFNADILTGDIITGINGQPVSSRQEFSSVIDANAGHTITLTIIRGLEHLEKSVQLLPARPAASQGQTGNVSPGADANQE